MQYLTYCLPSFVAMSSIFWLFTGYSRERAMCDRHDKKVPSLKPLVAACHLFCIRSLLICICSLLMAATPLHALAMQNYTDLQSKTSIDEISLLWLFRGCWTRIWYCELLFSSCFEDTGGCLHVQCVPISN